MLCTPSPRSTRDLCRILLRQPSEPPRQLGAQTPNPGQLEAQGCAAPGAARKQAPQPFACLGPSPPIRSIRRKWRVGEGPPLEDTTQITLSQQSFKAPLPVRGSSYPHPLFSLWAGKARRAFLDLFCKYSRLSVGSCSYLLNICISCGIPNICSYDPGEWTGFVIHPHVQLCIRMQMCMYMCTYQYTRPSAIEFGYCLGATKSH